MKGDQHEHIRQQVASNSSCWLQDGLFIFTIKRHRHWVSLALFLPSAAPGSGAPAAVGPPKDFLNCLQINETHTSWLWYFLCLFFFFFWRRGITYFQRVVDTLYPPIQTMHHFTQVYCFHFMAVWNRLSIQLVLFQLLPRLDFFFLLPNELGWASPAGPRGITGTVWLAGRSAQSNAPLWFIRSFQTVRRWRRRGEEAAAAPDGRTDGWNGQGCSIRATFISPKGTNCFFSSLPPLSRCCIDLETVAAALARL